MKYVILIVEEVIGKSAGPRGYTRYKPVKYSSAKDPHYIAYAKTVSKKTTAFVEFQAAVDKMNIIQSKFALAGGSVYMLTHGVILYNVTNDVLVTSKNEATVQAIGKGKQIDRNSLLNWGMIDNIPAPKPAPKPAAKVPAAPAAKVPAASAPTPPAPKADILAPSDTSSTPASDAGVPIPSEEPAFLVTDNPEAVLHLLLTYFSDSRYTIDNDIIFLSGVAIGKIIDNNNKIYVYSPKVQAELKAILSRDSIPASAPVSASDIVPTSDIVPNDDVPDASDDVPDASDFFSDKELIDFMKNA